jgi:hypothetical protein
VTRTDIIANDSAWALAVSGRLVMTVWRTDVTLARVQLVDRTIAKLVPTLGGEKYCSITLLEPTVSMRLPDDARASSTELQKRWGPHACCSAYLVFGEGFLAVSVRTLTAGMSLMTRSPHPIKVFSDTPSCASWVASFAERPASDIVLAMSQARSMPG